MSLKELFEIDYASEIGRLHVKKGMNNQDGMAVLVSDGFFIAVVGDGCSGGEHSEVGSYLLSNYIARRLAASLPDYMVGKSTVESLMEEIRLDTMSFLRTIASQLGSTAHYIVDSMLSTALGFVVTPEYTFVFSIGDGVIYINSQEIFLGNEHAKYPDMLVYGAMKPESLSVQPSRFAISGPYPTDTISNILVSTDGFHYYAQAYQLGLEIPNSDEPIPPVPKLWKPGTSLTSLYRRINQEVRRAHYDKTYDVVTQTVTPSPFLDDITTIVLRRLPTDDNG